MSSSELTGSWKKEGHWRDRYSKLYSSRNVIRAKEDESLTQRISLLSSDLSPDGSILYKLGRTRLDSPNRTSLSSYTVPENEVANHVSEREPDTQLLDMIRKQSKQEEQVQPLEINIDSDSKDSDDDFYDDCGQTLTRHTREGSVSRSRISRISTKRDIDIPSLMAFSNSIAKSMEVKQQQIPAFQEVSSTNTEDIPRWSIRRSVCPACSQKWRDKTSIKIVKYSGLKRSSGVNELPSVIAPARLRTSLALNYVPRPTPLALDKDAGMVYGGWRSSNSTKSAWKLTRARRYRAPNTKMPSPEAIAPLSITAPLARKDLEKRVSQFLAS